MNAISFFQTLSRYSNENIQDSFSLSQNSLKKYRFDTIDSFWIVIVFRLNLLQTHKNVQWIYSFDGEKFVEPKKKTQHTGHKIRKTKTKPHNSLSFFFFKSAN